MDAEAYEVNKDDLSNGIFISYLKKRLMEDEKVTVMLDRVAEGKTFCPYNDIALMKPCLLLKSCSFWYSKYISQKLLKLLKDSNHVTYHLVKHFARRPT